ncbi:hypothetical protein ACHHYP_12858 [Achlya hypogyna]|uniref:Uncharacterized protein n=1 Tax=Achlya hypogyna TaxID=1202772 RepID=A0A1V9ZFZ8_ACHHY|nr:hypothetical protein ACHHYP_12858 [Achlya hypogyna]
MLGADKYSAREILFDAQARDPDEAKAKNRQRLRDHRRLKKRQHVFLTERVAELMAQVAALEAARPLAWRDVATALEAQASKAQRTRRQLLTQLSQLEIVACSLERWVRTNIAEPRDSLLPHQAPWQDHTLLAPVPQRLRSLQWTTDRLYWNTEAAIGACRLQEQMSVALHTLSYDQTYVVIRNHRLVQASTEAALEAQRCMYLRTPQGVSVDDELVREAFGEDGMLEQVGSTRVVYRLVPTAVGGTMVALTITHDEASAEPLNHQCSYGWTCVERVDATMTRVLDAWIFLVETPPSTGGELEHYDNFLRTIRAAYVENLAHCNQLFLDTLASVQNAC